MEKMFVQLLVGVLFSAGVARLVVDLFPNNKNGNTALIGLMLSVFYLAANVTGSFI